MEPDYLKSDSEKVSMQIPIQFFLKNFEHYKLTSTQVFSDKFSSVEVFLTLWA